MNSVLAPAARARRRRRRRRVSPVLFVALLFVLAIPAAMAARDALHRGETMPGVEVLGTDVSGLGRADAAAEIRAATAKRLAEPVTLKVEGKQVRVSPKLLFTLDRKATTTAALHAGRESLGTRARALLAPLAG